MQRPAFVPFGAIAAVKRWVSWQASCFLSRINVEFSQRIRFQIQTASIVDQIDAAMYE